MKQPPANTQKQLEKTVSSAIAELAKADQNDQTIANAHDAALDLQTLLSRPMRIAIGGEFSSGKSTFAKMLLGRHVVDMQASASAMPTVNFLYGSKTGYRAIGAKGSREVSDVSALAEDELRALKCLEVTVDLPFLQRFELFDTPGTSDPSRDVDQLLTVADQVDFIIWCTNATQAWRESERRMWETLPFELKKGSMLLVTHVDLPSVKPSLKRLMKRLQKDAAPLFGKVIPIELLAATSARDETGKVTDQAAWEASGGAQCLSSMEEIAAEIRADVFENITFDLQNKILPVIATLKSASAEFLPYWAQELNTTRQNNSGANNSVVVPGYLELLDSALGFVQDNAKPWPEDGKRIAARIEEARAYLRDARHQKTTDTNTHESHAVIEQLDWEFKHLDMLT